MNRNMKFKNEIDIFKNYLDHLCNGNLIIDIKNMSIYYYNKAFLEILDLKDENLNKDFILQFIDKNNEQLQNLLYGKIEYFSYEKKYSTNSNTKWLLINISSYHDKLIIQINDISNQKKDKAILDSILENTDNVIWSIDSNYNLISFNTSFFNLIKEKFNIELKSGLNMLFFINSVNIFDYIERCLYGENITIERENNKKFCEFSFTPIFINEHKLNHATNSFEQKLSEIEINRKYKYSNKKDIAGVYIFSKDITKRKVTELNLLDINQKFKNLFDHSHIGMAIISLEGNYIKVNKAVSNITGYSKEELLKISFKDITHKDDLEKDSFYCNKIVENDKNNSFDNYFTEKRYFHKNGNLIYISLNTTLVRDENNKPLYFLSQIQDITEKKLKEIELNEINQKFKNAFDISPIGISIVSLDGKFLKVNKSICNILGYTKEELLKKTFMELTYKEDLDIHKKYMIKLFNNEINYFTLEKRYVHKNGNIIFVKLNISLVKDENNKPLYFLAQLHNITERKNQELKIIELKKKFENIYNNSKIGLSILSLEGNWLDFNNAICEILGYSKEELLNKSLEEITHPEDLFKESPYLRKIYNNEIDSIDIEKRFFHKNGYILFADLNLSLLRDENNKPQYYLVQVQNVTDKKKFEEEIKLNQSKLLSLIENTSSPIWSVNLEGEIISFNYHFKEIMLKLFNKEVKEGDSIISLIKGKSLKEWKKLYKKATKGEYISENIKIKKSYFNLSLNPIIYNKKIIGITVVSNDITSKKQLEKKLLDTQEKFRGAFENSPIGMRITDTKGKTIKVNNSLCNILGYTEKELFKMNYNDFTYPEDLENEERYVKLLKKGELDHFQIEKRLVHKNGNIIWALVNVSCIKNRKGKLEYTIAQVEDITHKKEAEIEIISKNQELELVNQELEQFTYIVSHDLIAPLNSIKGYAYMLELKRKGKISEDIYEHANTNIVKSVDKMKSFISDLLKYSRISIKRPMEYIDTNIVLDSAIKNLKATIDENNANITYDFLPDILANALKMEHLFQNLIENAIKYRKKDIDPIIHISYSEDSKYYTFSIQDNGIGIDKKYHDLIFRTFKRLHKENNYSGNGIGLSICKKIVDQFGGEIWFSSEVGIGTTFYFTIKKDL